MMSVHCNHESEQRTRLSPSSIVHEFYCKKCGSYRGECSSPIVPFWLADTGYYGVHRPQIELTRNKEPKKYKEVIVSQGNFHFFKTRVELRENEIFGNKKVEKIDHKKKKKHWWQ
jgi:hypothetical protein